MVNIKKVCIDCIYNNKLISVNTPCPFVVYTSYSTGYKQKFSENWNELEDFCSHYSVKRDRRNLLGKEVESSSEDTIVK